MSTATPSTTVTQLVRTERGWSLILDPEMAAEVGMTEGSAVIIRREGNSLVISPAPIQDPKKKFEEAKRDTFEKYDDVFRKLAE